MRVVRYRPARANWITLSTAGVTVILAASVAFRLAPAPCAVGAGPGGAAPDRDGAAGAPAAGTAAPAGRSQRLPRVDGRHWPGLPGTVYSGQALYYDPGTALGSCTLGPFPAGEPLVSLSPQQFAHSHSCGTYLRVRGAAGTVRAEVVDLCPSCRGSTINLSHAAYERVLGPSPGSAAVTYRWVADPPLRRPVTLRASTADTGLAMQVLSHGNRLASVAIAPRTGAAAARWQRLRLNPHDFWVATGVTATGPFAVRITDYLGHQLILPRVMLTPGTVARTGAWLYRPGRPAGAAPASARSRQAPGQPRPARGCPG